MADCVQSDLEKQAWGSVVESVSEEETTDRHRTRSDVSIEKPHKEKQRQVVGIRG